MADVVEFYVPEHFRPKANSDSRYRGKRIKFRLQAASVTKKRTTQPKASNVYKQIVRFISRLYSNTKRLGDTRRHASSTETHSWRHSLQSIVSPLAGRAAFSPTVRSASQPVTIHQLLPQGRGVKEEASGTAKANFLAVEVNGTAATIANG